MVSEKEIKYLYEDVGGMAVCQLCNKQIYRFGLHGGDAMNSHARKHVREGKAKEIHSQSKRCYAGYDIDFVIIEVE